jgi:replicative DNA helicase
LIIKFICSYLANRSADLWGVILQAFDPALEIRVVKTLLDNREASILTTLNGDWFGMPTIKEIWGRVETLKTNGKPIPSSQVMASDPVLSEGAKKLLEGTTKAFQTNEVEGVLDQLNRYREGRVIYKMLESVSKNYQTPTPDIKLARTEIEKCLRSLETPSEEKDVLSYGADNDKTLSIYETLLDTSIKDTFIRTGFSAIDMAQGGLSRGRLYTIGAPSGGGKSTLANSMAINMYWRDNRSVGYYSFEMNKEECLLRTQSNITRIPSERFQLRTLTPDERKKSDRIFSQFLSHGERNSCRLDYHCPSKDINISELFPQAEIANYDVVFVDYINLMAPLNPKEPLWANIGESFRLAKRWAEKTQKVVVMLVQIDEDTGAIKYAKSIKHHSDGVWVWPWGEKEKETGLVEVDQMKLRNFKPTKFQLQADFEFCSFTEGGMVAPPPSGAKSMNL